MMQKPDGANGWDRLWQLTERSRLSDVVRLALASAAILIVTAVFRVWLHVTNPTIAALSYLLVVLIASTISALWAAVAASLLAVLCLNYFFMPPVGTFVIADPENWLALLVFLAVSTIASQLSSWREQLLEQRQATKLAERSSELKSAVLASLGHDLRTPLTAIRVAGSNLQAAWLSEPERRTQSEIVTTEAERLSRLFQNILDMARIDANAVTIEREWVTPAEIVEAAVAQVKRTLQDHRLSIQADGEHQVQVDPRLTSAALTHVLENAAQYSPKGSGVAVEATSTSEGLRIVVRDEGHGIADVDLPNLFERFYRGSAARRRSFGTGMGLAITRGLLAAEGGRVWAENRPQRGAAVSIFVPAPTRQVALGMAQGS